MVAELAGPVGGAADRAAGILAGGAFSLMSVRYFLVGGGGPGGTGSLTTWIQQNSKAITVGGMQLYQYTE